MSNGHPDNDGGEASPCLGAPIPSEGDNWTVSIDFVPVDPWKGAVPLGTLFYLDDPYQAHFFLYYRAFLPGACLGHTLSGSKKQVKRLEPRTPLLYLGTYELKVEDLFGGTTHKIVKDLVWGIRFLVEEEELWEVYWPFPNETKFPEGFILLSNLVSHDEEAEIISEKEEPL